MKYFDVYNNLSGNWLCCVQEPTSEKALERVSTEYRIAVINLRAEERVETDILA